MADGVSRASRGKIRKWITPTLDPAAQGIERMRQKLELERQNAIAAAEAHARLAVQRKEATPAEAEKKKGLEIRKAELTYQQKLAEVEAKNRDVRVRFYEQLAQLSGNYTETIRLQTEALREQAWEFEGAGIAPPASSSSGVS